MIDSWVFYVTAFVILQVAFLQLFKLASRKSVNIGALTVIVQLGAALSALLLVPFFDWKLPDFAKDWDVWLLLGLALVFYAGADRLNAAARKNMDISTETMLHQTWKLLFLFGGMLPLAHLAYYGFSWVKFLGGVIIVLVNMSLFAQDKSFKINRYVVMKIIAVVCFASAMTLDVANSGHFNLPFYVFISFSVPAIFLVIAGQAGPKRIWAELKTNILWVVLLCAFCNGIGAVMILRAYQLEYFMSAAISSVYVILNVFFAYIFLKEHDNLMRKFLAAAVIVCTIVLITVQW